jgi:hypothetical protein
MGSLHYNSDTFTTVTGLRVKAVDPKPSDINLTDIATALSRICRFGGHVRGHVSVAAHCVLVSRIVKDMGGTLQQQFHALLHDASEAYIGDMISPLKQHQPEFEEVEDRWALAIGEAFGVGDVLKKGDPLVKAADVRAFHSEWRDNFPERGLLLDADPSPLYGGPMEAIPAKTLFLNRYKDLAEALGGQPLAMLRSRR